MYKFLVVFTQLSFVFQIVYKIFTLVIYKFCQILLDWPTISQLWSIHLFALTIYYLKSSFGEKKLKIPNEILQLFFRTSIG